MKEKINICWFKRDLRLEDHAALNECLADQYRVVLLYIFEPIIYSDTHYSNRHFQFISDSIEDLNNQLKEINSRILVIKNNAQEAFEILQEKLDINAVYSHEETGLEITYQRDLDLAGYFKKQDISWFEYPSNGVTRGLSNRENWIKDWYKTMSQPILSNQTKHYKEKLLSNKKLDSLYQSDKIPYQYNKHIQEGGETKAKEVLVSFLKKRHYQYGSHISKPALSRESCSRLSPYIAWGNISIRYVYQQAKEAKKEGNKRALNSFMSRLRWHCHFIQKFESQYTIENEPINKAYQELTYKKNDSFHEAWILGKTGFPLIDACMRCLNTTGYMNFRMRAMLISFYVHNLQLDWRNASYHLSKQFLDFEPGIHYAQIQMQAGLTGTNTLRIYNPTKQGYDHDPTGSFIKKWVPELINIPEEYIHEPNLIPPLEQQFLNITIGIDYPLPIVNIKLTSKESRNKLWEIRNSKAGKYHASKVLKRHVIPNIKRTT